MQQYLIAIWSKKHVKQITFKIMIDRYIKGIAGSFVLISLLLAYFVNPNWAWFTAFVGANLLQSAFTNWCLMETFLRKMGVKD